MNETNPSVVYPALGPMRLEGAGALEVARSAATGQRVWLRRVTASAMAQEAIDTALAMPRHAGLSAAIEAGTWQRDVWLAGDFPDGKLLGDASDKVPADFVAIAEGLVALHAAGLSHGLLSGDAVLLATDGRTLLYEVPMLELNRATDRRPEQTALAHLQRTAAYFSPERLKGAPPSAADDVYALAALVCLATGGARPPRGSALEQLHAVMLGAWKPMPAEGLAADVKGLLLRMLSVDPAQRPAMKDVVGGLRPFTHPALIEGPEAVRPFPIAVESDVPLPVEAPNALPEEYVVPLPAPTVPGMPSFDFSHAPLEVLPAPYVVPPPMPTVPFGSFSAMPAPAPTVPTTPVRQKTPAPLKKAVQLGGAATPRPVWSLATFTISIAASDAKLITAGMLAMAMIASTIALGAHVMAAREEAVALTTAQVVKPQPRKEQKYNAEQLKQILRQKEEARREY